MLDKELADLRNRMVDEQIVGRGIHDPAVIAALREVPRECLRSGLPAQRRLRGFAAADRRRPDHLAAVHRRADARGGPDRTRRPGARSRRRLRLRDRAGEPDRRPRLRDRTSRRPCARRRGERLAALGHGRPSRTALRRRQRRLAGGRAVRCDRRLGQRAGGTRSAEEPTRRRRPAGACRSAPTRHSQRLVCITRRDATRFDEETLCAVRFVPLIGAQAWPDRAAYERQGD